MGRLRFGRRIMHRRSFMILRGSRYALPPCHPGYSLSLSPPRLVLFPDLSVFIRDAQLGLTTDPGKHELGNFRYIPNGLPGVETRTPILWSEGVLKGRITPQRFVELNSTNAAKLCRSLLSRVFTHLDLYMFRSDGMYPQSEWTDSLAKYPGGCGCNG